MFCIRYSALDVERSAFSVLDMRFFFAVLSVSTKTESPAYAPASSSKMFPGFRFAAERHDSLGALAMLGTPSQGVSPISLDRQPAFEISHRKVFSRKPLPP